MDISAVTTLIGSLGFPIVCCITMFYYMVKQGEQHKQEMDKVTEALNNNTIALTKLADKMGVNLNE